MYTKLNNISDLPKASLLKKISQSLATLDAIMMPDWDFRYFSFNNRWDYSESMASMRDGSGDEYFILFNDTGVIGKVFSKETEFSTEKKLKSLSKNIPKVFSSFFKEPAFTLENTSFLFFSEKKSTLWNSNPIDRKLPLLGFLSKNNHIDVYLKFSEEYYEKKLDERAVNKIFSHTPLDEDLIQSINKNSSMDIILNDIKEIGYPLKS